MFETVKKCFRGFFGAATGWMGSEVHVCLASVGLCCTSLSNLCCSAVLLRCAVVQMTDRTSVPNIWIAGACIRIAGSALTPAAPCRHGPCKAATGHAVILPTPSDPCSTASGDQAETSLEGALVPVSQCFSMCCVQVQHRRASRPTSLWQPGLLNAVLAALCCAMPCCAAGQNVGGCNDGPGVMTLHKEGKLVPLLKQAGALA